MFSYICKNFSNVCMLCVIAGTFLVATFQLVSVNATRDRKSDGIRRIEKECAALTEEIKSLQATKARLCNTEILRGNAGLPKDFKEPEQIIRVRTTNIPHGVGRAVSVKPKALAVELSELAAYSTER